MPWTTTDRDIMRDVYRLLQAHPDPDGTRAYRDSLMTHAKELYNKYGGSLLAFHMISAVIDYYGEKQKQLQNTAYFQATLNGESISDLPIWAKSDTQEKQLSLFDGSPHKENRSEAV